MKANEFNLLLDTGEIMKVGTCECSACNNIWFVVAQSVEFNPKYCPYCGIKFTYYDDANGALRNIAGFNMENGDENS